MDEFNKLNKHPDAKRGSSGCEKEDPQGKMCGRTFGVQSLRKVAGCEPGHRLAGPEALLSLLPKKAEVDYTLVKEDSLSIGRCRKLNFKLSPSRLKFTVSMQRVRISLGLLYGLCLTNLQTLYEQAVEQIAQLTQR